MKNELSRKEFLEKLPLLGIAFLGSGLLLHGCSKSETDEDPCADLSKLTDEEKQTRNDFEYVSKSISPDQVCDNCELWINPEEGTICGRCAIMEGPIHPKGYCNAWVEISQ